MGSKDLPWFVAPPVRSSKRVRSPSDFVEPPVRSSKRVKPLYDFVEPPVRPSKRAKSPVDFIEPPIKVKERPIQDFIEPYQPPKQQLRGSDFIESPTRPAPRKRSSATRDRSTKPAKPREKKNVDRVTFGGHDGGYVDGSGFSDGGGGFKESSSENQPGVKDAKGERLKSEAAVGISKPRSSSDGAGGREARRKTSEVSGRGASKGTETNGDSGKEGKKRVPTRKAVSYMK
jgi:hypothetical protein